MAAETKDLAPGVWGVETVRMTGEPMMLCSRSRGPSRGLRFPRGGKS